MDTGDTQDNARDAWAGGKKKEGRRKGKRRGGSPTEKGQIKGRKEQKRGKRKEGMARK